MNLEDRFAAETHALLTTFRSQTPIRAGSLLVTILGDAIAPRGGPIALSSLIALARPFGITERLVRTSIGRLASEDWVRSHRIGRSSYYALTSTGRSRFSEATQRIYSSSADVWNGEWSLIIVPHTLRGAARQKLVEKLHRLNFGELSHNVYAHPMHGDSSVRGQLARLDGKDQLIVIEHAALAEETEAQLLANSWDFAELSRRYRRFVAMFDPVDRAVTSAEIPSEAGKLAFTLRTLLLHEYRKVHLQDPMFPQRLLPADWTRADALELCRRLYIKVFRSSELYLSATVRTTSGQFPSPSSDMYNRFGGLPIVSAP